MHQPPPGLGNQYEDDRVLRSYLARVLPESMLKEIEPALIELGRLAGGELYQMQLADRLNEPKLTQWDAWGNRIDAVEVTPLWRASERIAVEHGLVATAYEQKHGSLSRVHQCALAYLFTPSTDIYSCPLAMTDGAARTLLSSGNQQLIDHAVPHLITRNPANFWTAGQWMTELTGGSDVGASETIAKQVQRPTSNVQSHDLGFATQVGMSRGQEGGLGPAPVLRGSSPTIREGVRNQDSTLETATQVGISQGQEGGLAPALKTGPTSNVQSQNPQSAVGNQQSAPEARTQVEISSNSKLETENWKLYGNKWFASAITSQIALTLARPEGNPPGGRGLALFYIELRDEQGRLRNIQINRLKDKLGTRKVPTAELTLAGTPAQLVKGPSDGVRNIAPLLNITRLWNGISAVSLMRRGVALALDYARKRVAFGSPLVEKPLHIDTLASLQAEAEAAFHLAFYVAELTGCAETASTKSPMSNVQRPTSDNRSETSNDRGSIQAGVSQGPEGGHAPALLGTESGPGSPAGQPGWGGGSDRMLDSTPEEVGSSYTSTEQDKYGTGSGSDRVEGSTVSETISGVDSPLASTRGDRGPCHNEVPAANGAVARPLGRAPSHEGSGDGVSNSNSLLLRLLTPVMKLTTGKQAVMVLSEVIEAFGGAGYVEDTGLPQLLRDAQVLPIWEGTTNVLSLDTLRALGVGRPTSNVQSQNPQSAISIQHSAIAGQPGWGGGSDRPVAQLGMSQGQEGGHAPALGRNGPTSLPFPAFRSAVSHCLQAARDPRLTDPVRVTQSALAHAEAWLAHTSNEDLEAGARRFAMTLGRTMELALLIKHAQWSQDHEADARALAAARRFANSGIDLLVDHAFDDARALFSET